MQRGEVADRVTHTYEPYRYVAVKRPRSEMDLPAPFSRESFKVQKEYRRQTEQMAQLPRLLASSISIESALVAGHGSPKRGSPQTTIT